MRELTFVHKDVMSSALGFPKLGRKNNIYTKTGGLDHMVCKQLTALGYAQVLFYLDTSDVMVYRITPNGIVAYIKAFCVINV